MTDQQAKPADAARIVIYGTEYCPYCTAARMLLTKKGVNFVDVSVSNDDEKRQEMTRLSGGHTVPQIFIDGQPIGGFDDLYTLDMSGKLDEMLATAPANQTSAADAT